MRVRRNVEDVQITADSRKHDRIVYRFSVMLRNRFYAPGNAENGADVSRVAVGVPTGHRGDFNSLGKSFAVNERHNADARIRNDVACSGVFIVAVLRMQKSKAVFPVGSGMFFLK